MRAVNVRCRRLAPSLPRDGSAPVARLRGVKCPPWRCLTPALATAGNRALTRLVGRSLRMDIYMRLDFPRYDVFNTNSIALPYSKVIAIGSKILRK